MAYGVGKAACDRMAADCAFELRKSGVSMVSLWPGPVKTEFITEKMTSDANEMGKAFENGEKRSSNANQMAKVFEKGETIEYAGKAVVHLAADKNIMARSGKIINTADIGREFGFVDITGESPIDFRLEAQIGRIVKKYCCFKTSESPRGIWWTSWTGCLDSGLYSSSSLVDAFWIL